MAESLESIDDETEYDAARALVRSPAAARPTRRRAARQLVGLLAREGYSPGLSMRVVGEALDEAP